MIFLVCGLIILIIILLTIIVNNKREVRFITKQIDANKQEYINIRTKSVDKDIENLVTKINSLYDENQRINAEKKKVEEEIRTSVANMSHDLRTPLTSIRGYIQLFKADNISKEEKKEYIDIIEKRTKTLQVLISSFYDLSRIENNEYRFNLEKVNLSKILCENLAGFYNDFVNNSIEPIVDIDENVSHIISDEKAAIRIFSNLINNAIKHGKSHVNISLKEDNGVITTEFINGTSGLKDEDVSKLFDRFYTADKSRNDRNTGLGLAITKSLVEQLGNEIEAKLVEEDLVITIKWRSAIKSS